ncbi:MAG: hypothetical protein LIO71_05040 [Ruminococcus sp.]|nr:hypothetical protein [Ruminococcus sp.]MCD7800708.1 hypothetical protein [Ruminococcus sp.]
MKLSNIFDKGVKYFGNEISPKCEYCEFGTRSKGNSKILCTKNGLVSADYSCNKFIYSPLKRIPVKQLNIEESDSED